MLCPKIDLKCIFKLFLLFKWLNGAPVSVFYKKEFGTNFLLFKYREE